MRPTKLEFAPLTELEMKLCLKLLSWPSGEPWPRKFIRHLDRMGYFLNVQRLVPLDEQRGLGGDMSKIMQLAYQRRDAENSRSLLRAQQKWRDRVICNDRASQEVIRQTRNRQRFDFDAYALAQFGQGLEGDMPPFRIQTERKTVTRNGRPKSSRKTVFMAMARPMIENFGSRFDWLFARATLNFQLSRFAHCVCCDRWELKRMGGKRSAAVAEFIAAKGVKMDSPAWVYRLPLWPAVCHRVKCKTTFQHVVRGNTPMRILSFRGLFGSRNSSSRISEEKSKAQTKV